MIDQHFLIKKGNLASCTLNFRTNPLSNLPRSGPQRCLLQAPVERWMGRQEPTCYFLVFAQLPGPLENEFHSLTGMRTVESQG